MNCVRHQQSTDRSSSTSVVDARTPMAFISGYGRACCISAGRVAEARVAAGRVAAGRVAAAQRRKALARIGMPQKQTQHKFIRVEVN